MSTILGELAGVKAKSARYTSLHLLAKLALPFSISLSLLHATEPVQALSLAAVSALACILAGVSLKVLKKYIAVIVSMSAFIVLAFTLFTNLPGRMLYEITLWRMEAEKGVLEWKLSVTDTSLNYAAAFILRILAMVLSAALFLATVSDRDLVWGLLSLRMPFGVCVAASLFFRGTQLFISDFHTVREAMMARGVDFARTSLAKRFLLYVNALIPLLSLMITRSYEVSLALESRGIAPKSRMASGYHSFKLNRHDYTVVALSILLLLAFAAWGWLA